ncbi:MAG: hypothetical protein GF311_08625 [Candidatus Lokiarchaeota archaeon]|nr:hypothetical protein [Candidatus Lokiarchaeota archaeon]
MTHFDLYNYNEVRGSDWDYDTLRPPLTFREVLSDIIFHWFVYGQNHKSILKRISFLVLRIFQRISYNIGWIYSSYKFQKEHGGKIE